MHAFQRRRVREADALAVASLLWILVLFLRYVLPPLFETFQREFAVTSAELGMAYSGLMIGYAVMQFPAGWLADRVGMIEVIAGGALVFSAAALILGSSATWLGLVLAVVLLGLGTGGHKTVSISLLSVLHPQSKARALGVLDTVGQFGGVVAPAAVVAVGVMGLGWRSIFVAATAVGVGLALVFYRVGRRRLAAVRAGADATPGPGAENGDDRGSASGGGSDGATGSARTDRPSGSAAGPDRSYLTLFGRRRFQVFVLVTVLVAFCWNGLVAFLPLYLTDVAGLSPDAANLLFSILFAASLSQPVLGQLSDWTGTLPVMTGAVVAAGVAIVALLVTSGLLAMAVAVVSLGFGMHGFRPARDAYLTDIIPASVASGTLGMARTVMIVAGGVAPFFVGVVADLSGFRVAFAVLAAAVLAAGIAVAGLYLTVEGSAPAGPR